MCIACEMAFMDMIETLPPAERERILREEAARFGAPAPTAPFVCEPSDDERKDAPKP